MKLVHLTTYLYNDMIVYKLEWNGGSLECTDVKLMAKTLARYFRTELAQVGHA